MLLSSYVKPFGVMCAIAVALAACFTPYPVTPYQAPTAGETAKLLFKPNVLLGRRYVLQIYRGPVTCTGPMSVFSGQGPANVAGTTIQANTLNSLSLSGIQGGRSCKAVVSFYPKVGHSYQLEGKVDELGCMVSMQDITNPNSPQPESSLLSREMKGEVCAPLSEAKKIGAGTGSSMLSKPTLDDFKDLLPSK